MSLTFASLRWMLGYRIHIYINVFEPQDGCQEVFLPGGNLQSVDESWSGWWEAGRGWTETWAYLAPNPVLLMAKPQHLILCRFVNYKEETLCI